MNTARLFGAFALLNAFAAVCFMTAGAWILILTSENLFTYDQWATLFAIFLGGSALGALSIGASYDM